MPLAAALEPDPARLGEQGGEAVGVGDFSVYRVKQHDILRAGPVEPGGAAAGRRVDRIAARSGNVDDQGVGAAGRGDEPLPYVGADLAPAHHDDGAFGRANPGSLSSHRVRYGDECGQEKPGMYHGRNQGLKL